MAVILAGYLAGSFSSSCKSNVYHNHPYEQHQQRQQRDLHERDDHQHGGGGDYGGVGDDDGGRQGGGGAWAGGPRTVKPKVKMNIYLTPEQAASVKALAEARDTTIARGFSACASTCSLVRRPSSSVRRK